VYSKIKVFNTQIRKSPKKSNGELEEFLVPKISNWFAVGLMRTRDYFKSTIIILEQERAICVDNNTVDSA
jgi:hypothetical protein